MTISITTACNKTDARLERTAASILNQSAVLSGRIRLEYFIVTCDPTPDREMLSRLEERGACIITEPDKSLYDGLAKGLTRSTGDVVGYLNAGDLYHPEAFAILEDVFRLKDVEWVTGYSALCNDFGQMIAAWKPARFDPDLFACGAYCSLVPRRPWVQQESTFWNRRLHGTIDYDRLRTFRLAGDYFLWMTFSQTAPLRSVLGFLGSFLINPGQLTEDLRPYVKEIQPHLAAPTRSQRLRMFIDFKCSWRTKVRMDRLLRRDLARNEIGFNIQTNQWEFQ